MRLPYFPLIAMQEAKEQSFAYFYRIWLINFLLCIWLRTMYSIDSISVKRILHAIETDRIETSRVNIDQATS